MRVSRIRSIAAAGVIAAGTIAALAPAASAMPRGGYFSPSSSCTSGGKTWVVETYDGRVIGYYCQDSERSGYSREFYDEWGNYDMTCHYNQRNQIDSCYDFQGE